MVTYYSNNRKLIYIVNSFVLMHAKYSLPFQLKNLFSNSPKYVSDRDNRNSGN